MYYFKEGVAVIVANPMAMLVVHSRRFQTERPFPSSLPSLVWDLSSGNKGMRCEELLAMEWVLQQKQLRLVERWLESGSRAGLWFLGAAAGCARDLHSHGSLCSCFFCSGSPRGWSYRDRTGLAPATVSWFHSLLCTQQQPLCALLMIYPRGQSLFLSPSQTIVLACCFHRKGWWRDEGLLRLCSLQWIETMFKLLFKNVMCKVLIKIKAGVLVV